MAKPLPTSTFGAFMAYKCIALVFVIHSFASCKAQTITGNTMEKPCHLIEETFENSPLRKYLKTTEFRRDIIDAFLDDTSQWSILSIVDNNILFAKCLDDVWEVQTTNDKYTVHNSEIVKIVEQYSHLNKVYKMSCPKGYEVYDIDEFQGFWIKKKGEMKLVYYSVLYEMSEFNDTDMQKLSGINAIKEALRQ